MNPSSVKNFLMSMNTKLVLNLQITSTDYMHHVDAGVL